MSYTKEQREEWRKKDYAKYPEKYAARDKKYRLNNLEKINEKRKLLYKNILSKDPEFIEKRKIYYLNNRERFSLKRKEYRIKNRENVLKKDKERYKIRSKTPEYIARRKTYNLKNKDSLNEKSRQYYIKNKAKFVEKGKAYNLKNRDYINKRNNKRRATDIQFRLQLSLRVRLNDVIKKNLRRGSAVRDLGCTLSELKIHLESKFQPGMSWKNWGHSGKVWHIDHIKPLSKFDLTDREQLLQAVHYTNLQPLWAMENYKKGNRV